MSKRKTLAKRAKKKLQKAAANIINNLTPEQQDKLAEVLAKAVTDVSANENSTSR